LNASLIAGWSLILAGFVSGAGIGLGFHRADFLGGYGSFRRRVLRLGHVACVALGMLNLLAVLASDRLDAGAGGWLQTGSWLLIAGGVAMPLVCFLTAWREKARHLFAVPVVALVVAAVLHLAAALSD
jgi:hypothetical protein